MCPSPEADDDFVFGYADGCACADELSEQGPGASIFEAVSDAFGEHSVEAAGHEGELDVEVDLHRDRGGEGIHVGRSRWRLRWHSR